jgi:hypothetical protein
MTPEEIDLLDGHPFLPPGGKPWVKPLAVYLAASPATARSSNRRRTTRPSSGCRSGVAGRVTQLPLARPGFVL